MSCLLRSTLGLCRAHKSLGISHLIKARPLTHLTTLRVDQPLERSNPVMTCMNDVHELSYCALLSPIELGVDLQQTAAPLFCSELFAKRSTCSVPRMGDQENRALLSQGISTANLISIEFLRSGRANQKTLYRLCFLLSEHSFDAAEKTTKTDIRGQFVASAYQALDLQMNVKPLLLANKLQSFSVTPAISSRGVHDAHDHSKIWTLERLLSIALMPAVPLGIMYPNILFDLLISIAITMHVHWGVEAVVVDYVRPIIFGKLIPKLALGLVYAFSVVLLIGLLNLTLRGPGVGNSINTLWSM